LNEVGLDSPYILVYCRDYMFLIVIGLMMIVIDFILRNSV